MYVDMMRAGRPLPPDVCAGEYASFYQLQETDLSREELAEYLQYKQACDLETIKNNVKTIKNCVVFFTTLTVISLIIALIVMMNA